MLQVSSSSYSEYTDLLFFNFIASLHTLIIPYNNVVFRNITEIRKHRLVCDVSLFLYQFYVSDTSHNPLLLSLLWIMCCCLYSKGKNFRANHNAYPLWLICFQAVAYIAKVRILEQITTALFVLSVLVSCCLYSKGKNFRANHNYSALQNRETNAVAYIAKVRILEQITTISSVPMSDGRLLLI